MNKILFALLFTSVSFCATQEASAGPRKPKTKKTITDTSIRRLTRIDPLTIIQNALEEVIKTQILREQAEKAEMEMEIEKITFKNSKIRKNLFSRTQSDDVESWLRASPFAFKEDEED